jgi:P27 family predicted phage terminase small subunit
MPKVKPLQPETARGIFFLRMQNNSHPPATKGQIMNGRKRLPTEIKRIKGTLQQCRINLNEPKPTGILTEPPAYMSEGAKAAWMYALKYAPPNLLTSIDMSVLEVWACAASLYRQAQEELQATGLIMKAPKSGVPIISPYLSIANKQAQVMMRAAVEMGFTPASRSRVEVASPVVSGDEWEGF